MKKLIKITVAALAAGMTVTLAGCSGCAGCSGNARNLTVINSNWYSDTTFGGIQQSFILSDEHPEYTKEEIQYSVTFDGTNSSNTSYSVEYNDGKFVTEFYATQYDWNAENIPSNYRSAKPETVYCYKTVLTISVKYTLKGGASSDGFNDSVETLCYFRSAKDNLQPVYSKQVLKTTSPAENKADSLDKAYKRVDVTYENFYNKNCVEITSVTTEAGKQPETKVYGGLNKLKTSLFDNSSLYVALRGMKFSTTSAHSINLFSPAAGGISTYTAYSGINTLGAEERKSISAALEKKELYVPVTKDADGNDVEDAGVKYNAVSVAYTGGPLSGSAQTVWYAAVENADNNTSRATMLKMSVPLSFGLGTLNYVLEEVNSTLWNK